VRVAHLTTVHRPDDQRIFAKECRALAAAGYDVHLVVAAAADGHGDHGVAVRDVGAGSSTRRSVRMTLAVAKVLRAAMRLDADVYHFHDPELIPVALLLRLLGRRVVYDAHEDLRADILDKAWIPGRLRRPAALGASALERAAARRFSAIVTATPAIAERFRGVRGPVVTVNNYPRLAEFEHLAPAGPSDTTSLCFVGGITEVRGIETMVHAIGRTGGTLALAGQFSPPTLEHRLRGLPGYSRVVVLGQLGRPAVVDLMNRSRAGLVLYQPIANHIRSQPTKIFEYMAAGLPVIASHFPLWREIVEGNDCGICVDPTDPAAVADAIQSVIDDPGMARRMGANGRRAAVQKYTWEVEAAKLTSLYAELTEVPRGRGDAA
jgi:glycosyltransferase involved in cell wall biosynthesis